MTLALTARSESPPPPLLTSGLFLLEKSSLQQDPSFYIHVMVGCSTKTDVSLVPQTKGLASKLTRRHLSCARTSSSRSLFDSPPSCISAGVQLFLACAAGLLSCAASTTVFRLSLASCFSSTLCASLPLFRVVVHTSPIPCAILSSPRLPSVFSCARPHLRRDSTGQD